MSTIKVAIIPSDDIKPIEFVEIENTLEAKQKIVDGRIEAVRLRDSEQGSVAMDFYCNDEFLFRDDLEPNYRAIALYIVSFNTMGLIKGDVVCIGGVDQHGNDKGLNAKQEKYLKVMFE
jgi:hypothetical protein